MLRQIAKLVLLATLIVPTAGHALGLGEIRVTSNLNQPLEAEIELTSVRAGELDTLQIRLASAEAFERVGLDRPFILTQLQFEVARDERGRPVIKVTTREAIREPFLNFLVEASWARGRLLREFTVLLDPPVLMPATITPVQTPAAPRRPAPETTRPVPRLPSAARVPEGGWLVQRNQTLWEIARDTRPEGTTINQMMLAILAANPDAFAGNINVMYAGHVLRIPDRSEVTRRSVADSASEVRRQNDAWRAGETVGFRVAEAGPAAGDARLRLRAPGTDDVGTDPAGRPGADEALRDELAATRQELEDERAAREALASRLVELETEAEDLRSRLELRDEDLAALTETRPTPEPEPEVERPRPTPPPVVDEPDPGIMGLLTNPLVLALLLGIPVIGALAFVALRRRRDAAEASEALGGEDADDEQTQFDAAYDDDATLVGAEAAAAADADDAAAAEPVDDDAAGEPAAAEAATGQEGGEPLTATGIMELDESDPTSEADFHLAYGLYDQAAELMEESYKQHPDRVPYLMKLLEIYFAWGKTDEFVKHAREGREKLEAAGEWSNVAILGRQMGDDELFSDTGSTMTQTRSDLDLDVAGDAGDSGGDDVDVDTGKFEQDVFDDVFGEDGDDAAAEEPAAEAPPAEEAPAAEEKKSDDGGLEFDLGDFEYPEGDSAEPEVDAGETQVLDVDGLDMPAEPEAEDDGGTEVIDLDAEPEKTQFKLDDEDKSDDDVSLDMDLDAALEGMDTGDSESVESELSGGDDDGLTMDFDSLLAEDADGDDADGGDDAPASDSRLDLARAYIDMGDADGARSLLNEVMAEGDEDQKREAKELLDLIG